jgi:phage-related protein
MDILIPRIKKVGEAFGSLMEFLADNPQIAKTIGFIMAIGTGLALIIGPALVLVGTIGFMVPLLEAGFAVLSAVFAAAIAPILITLGVILAVAAAGYLIYKNWGAIKTFFINLWTSIKVIAGSVWNWLATNWKTIVTVILLAMGPIGWVFLWIIRVIRTNWDSIVKFLKDSVEWVKKAWIPISKFFSELWDGIKSAAASAWRWIVDEVKAAIKEISNSPVVKWIIETGGKVVKGISDWTFGADNESDMKSGITPTKNNSDKLLGLYRQSDKGNGKNGGNMTVGDINITTQPGQNSKEIAKEVIKELGRDSRNKQMSRGSEPVMAWP